MTSRLLKLISEFKPKEMEWYRYQTNFKVLNSNGVTDPKVNRTTLLANINMEALAYVKDLKASTALDDDAVTFKAYRATARLLRQKDNGTHKPH